MGGAPATAAPGENFWNDVIKVDAVAAEDEGFTKEDPCDDVTAAEVVPGEHPCADVTAASVTEADDVD